MYNIMGHWTTYVAVLAVQTMIYKMTITEDSRFTIHIISGKAVKTNSVHVVEVIDVQIINTG